MKPIVNKDEFEKRLQIVKDKFNTAVEGDLFSWDSICGIFKLNIKRNWTTESSNSNYQINTEDVADFFPILQISEAFGQWRLAVEAFIDKESYNSITGESIDVSWIEGKVTYRHKIQSGNYSYLQITLDEGLRAVKNALRENNQLFFVKKLNEPTYFLFATKDNVFDEDRIVILSPNAVSKDTSAFHLEKMPKEQKTLVSYNTIYYGAPGTGKSHNLDEVAESFDFLERVTFYPEYTHDDFIGAFMPSMSYVKNDTTEYIFADGTNSTLPGKPVPYYTFIPGPFTTALVHALNNSDKSVLLIVEELNRANAAAVFGEFFQLLDRKDSGESKYTISVSNEYSEFLSSKVPTYSKGQKVTIPSNLIICATMNSADQGVNPLDSAFKRRWNFKYVPIDFTKAEHRDYKIDYAKGKVTWETFATTINEQLKKKEINEDKHLGQYFITKTEIEDLYKFASKILLYLFDDVLKFNRRGFFKSDYKTFSDLLQGFLNGHKIFEFEFKSEVTRGTDGEGQNEVALDNQLDGKVSEDLDVSYAEQPENGDMPRVAEDGNNEFHDKVF